MIVEASPESFEFVFALSGFHGLGGSRVRLWRRQERKRSTANRAVTGFISGFAHCLRVLVAKFLVEIDDICCDLGCGVRGRHRTLSNVPLRAGFGRPVGVRAGLFVDCWLALLPAGGRRGGCLQEDRGADRDVACQDEHQVDVGESNMVAALELNPLPGFHAFVTDSGAIRATPVFQIVATVRQSDDSMFARDRVIVDSERVMWVASNSCDAACKLDGRTGFSEMAAEIEELCRRRTARDARNSPLPEKRSESEQEGEGNQCQEPNAIFR